MNNIVQLVNLVTRRRLKKIELLQDIIPNNQKDNKYWELYQGIRSGKITSDESAASNLYGKDPKDKGYQMLKSRFKARLLNSLFFINPKNLESSTRAYFNAQRTMFLAKLLQLGGIHALAVKYAKKLQQDSIKYEYTDLLLSSSEILSYYASIRGDSKQLEKQYGLAQRATKLKQLELECHYFYQKLIANYAKSVGVKQELASHGFEFLKNAKQHLAEEVTYSIKYDIYRIWIFSHQINGDFKSAIAVCEEFENNFENSILYKHANAAEIALIKLNCYLCIKDYKNGIVQVEKSKLLIPESNVNHFTVLEFHLMLALHTRNYNDAVGIYVSAIEAQNFKAITEERRQRWKIFEAYINYLIDSNIVTSHAPIATFSIDTLLEGAHIYSKDKRGYNVAILIVQILFLLNRQEYVRIIDRTEALKTYVSRYLRKDEDYRSNAFIKMLLIMEKKDFDHDDTKRLSDKYYQKLIDPENPSGISELEVIPYEHLWEQVLEKLKQ